MDVLFGLALGSGDKIAAFEQELLGFGDDALDDFGRGRDIMDQSDGLACEDDSDVEIAGGSSREGSPDGEGEDDFSFTLTSAEYLDILFDELELPDLAKAQLKDTQLLRFHRAGLRISGSPSNLNLVRTMRQSLARRIALHRPKVAEVAELGAEIAALEEAKAEEDDPRLVELKERHGRLLNRSRRIAYIDPVDLRFNRFEPTPIPAAQAVMFCLQLMPGTLPCGRGGDGRRVRPVPGRAAVRDGRRRRTAGPGRRSGAGNGAPGARR